MEIQQGFSIYNKFSEEKEKYDKLYEKYGKPCSLKIYYNKGNNSINYILNKDSEYEERLSVRYSNDGKIADVYACTDANKAWDKLTPMLNNLGSGLFYYDFSSNYNPFSIVTPPHISQRKSGEMFDVMMQIAYEYIKQTNQNVTLGVSYEGYGYAHSPVAQIIHGKDVKIAPLDTFNKTVIYNPDILYALEYYNVKLADKEKSMMLFFEDEEYII